MLGEVRSRGGDSLEDARGAEGLRMFICVVPSDAKALSSGGHISELQDGRRRKETDVGIGGATLGEDCELGTVDDCRCERTSSLSLQSEACLMMEWALDTQSEYDSECSALLWLTAWW